MNTFGLAVTLPATVLGGWPSDRYGRKRVSFITNLAMEVRCTIFSVAYSLAMGLFAGTAPMVAEWMLKRENWHLGPALYMVAWLAPALWFVKRRRETAHAVMDQVSYPSAITG